MFSRADAGLVKYCILMPVSSAALEFKEWASHKTDFFFVTLINVTVSEFDRTVTIQKA